MWFPDCRFSCTVTSKSFSILVLINAISLIRYWVCLCGCVWQREGVHKSVLWFKNLNFIPSKGYINSFHCIIYDMSVHGTKHWLNRLHNILHEWKIKMTFWKNKKYVITTLLHSKSFINECHIYFCFLWYNFNWVLLSFLELLVKST